MKGKLLIPLLLMMFCCNTPTLAADRYRFRTMSPEGGFYYDGIKQITQDKNGFIWICMDYDLYRFDGFQYKKYYPYFHAMDPSRKWVFSSVITDMHGNLMINTDNGLYSYNAEADSFEKLTDKVRIAKVDKLNNLWVYEKSLWHMVDVQNDTIYTPLYDGDSITNVNGVFCLHNDNLYTFSGRKIYRYDYAKKEFNLCATIPLKDGSVRFALAIQGKLWVYFATHGLFQIDLTTFHIEKQYGLPPIESSNFVRTFHIDKKGKVWYGTLDGLYIFDPETREYSCYVHSKTDPFSLPNNSVWIISEDRQRNIWVGTYSGALCYVNIDETTALTPFSPHNSKLSHVPVSAFTEDDKYLWIGTEGGGINIMDKETGEFSYLTQRNKLSYNNIKSMVIDEKHNLWISMFKGGLDYYNPSTKQIINYKSIPNNPKSLLTNDIRKIILEPDSGLWIAYQYSKAEISYLSVKDNTLTHYQLDTIPGTYLFDMIRQGDKYIWLLSNEKLYRMDMKTRAVKDFVLDKSQYLGLFTFCLDDSGNLWIGTIGNGLIKLNPGTGDYTMVKTLLSDKIYSIYSICYDDGNIWMGTDNGLYVYNIAQNELHNLDQKEGTQGQVYYPLASMKGKDGILYFGGSSGFNSIDPKKIARNSQKPKTIISGFYIDHKPATPDVTYKHLLPLITLNYDQADFGFQFSSDNYHIPEKSHFKYRLNGYDERWIETDASGRTAMYSKVPAGTYTFEVLAANSDGVWSDTPTLLQIKRKPAPWASWPAYIIYTLLFAGVIYMIFRYYNDKKKLRMQLYLDNLEKDKQEQIHQAQLRFFTNISHDFRTPLSLIIPTLDKLRQEGLKEYYYRILHGNAQRLLNLVNELMDFRTVENGKMKLMIQPVDVNNFITETATDFIDYARQRNITYHIECSADLPANVNVDKNILEKVVMNLLNNAFKYTPNNGAITIKTSVGKDFVSQFKNNYTVGDVTPQNTFSIIVSDTGVGISNESIRNVFDRFYKVNTVNTNSHLGTGIGLALVKSLVLLHKGNISIYSERDRGTDMVVRLSLDPEVFNDKDFLKQEPYKPIITTPDKENKEYIPEQDDISIRNHKKILIVEDNEDLRNLIADFLSDQYEVTQAIDGIHALQFISDIDFDMIISDIMMPNKDGISLCNDVKGDINTSHIPFILLTAKTSLESKIEGIGSGADMYFEKPIDFNYLKLSIQNIFKNRQQLKDYYARNYFADSSELSSNEQDNKFLKQLTTFIEEHIDESEMDVNLIANELSMSRSKLYTKVKSLTGKSIVEFVLNYRLRKAAKLIIEENITMREVMMHIGIESQPYFTNAFKKMFGETPTAFAAKHKKK